MLAEHRRVAVDRGPVVIEQDRIAGGAHLAEPGMLDLLHHAARDDLRIVEHFLEVVHARARHAGHHQRLLEFVGVARADRGLDQRQQRVLVGLAAGIGGKARIAEMRG